MKKSVFSLIAAITLLMGCEQSTVSVENTAVKDGSLEKTAPNKAPEAKPIKTSGLHAPKINSGVPPMGTCQGLTKNSNARMDCCIKEAYKCFGLNKNDEPDSLVDSYVDACAHGSPNFKMMRGHCQ